MPLDIQQLHPKSVENGWSESRKLFRNNEDKTEALQIATCNIGRKLDTIRTKKYRNMFDFVFFIFRRHILQ